MTESIQNFIGRKFYSSEAKGKQLSNSFISSKFNFRGSRKNRGRNNPSGPSAEEIEAQRIAEENARMAAEKAAREAEARRVAEAKANVAGRLVNTVRTATQAGLERGKTRPQGMGAFIQSKAEADINKQIANANSLSPEESYQRALRGDKGYSAMSTETGAVITFTPDVEGAYATAKSDFNSGNKLRPERLRAIGASAVYGAVGFVKESVEFPVVLGRTVLVGSSQGIKSKGFIQNYKESDDLIRNFENKFTFTRELNDIPSDEIQIGVKSGLGLATLAVGGAQVASEFAATKGLPIAQRIGQTALKSSPFRFQVKNEATIAEQASTGNYFGKVNQFIDEGRGRSITGIQAIESRSGAKVNTLQFTELNAEGGSTTKSVGTLTYNVPDELGGITTKTKFFKINKEPVPVDLGVDIIQARGNAIESFGRVKGKKAEATILDLGELQEKSGKIRFKRAKEKPQDLSSISAEIKNQGIQFGNTRKEAFEVIGETSRGNELGYTFRGKAKRTTVNAGGEFPDYSVPKEFDPGVKKLEAELKRSFGNKEITFGDSGQVSISKKTNTLPSSDNPAQVAKQINQNSAELKRVLLPSFGKLGGTVQSQKTSAGIVQLGLGASGLGRNKKALKSEFAQVNKQLQFQTVFTKERTTIGFRGGTSQFPRLDQPTIQQNYQFPQLDNPQIPIVDTPKIPFVFPKPRPTGFGSDIPYIPLLPKIRFGDMGGKSILKLGKQGFRYQPSFNALVLNLRGGRQPRIIVGGYNPFEERRIGAKPFRSKRRKSKVRRKKSR